MENRENTEFSSKLKEEKRVLMLQTYLDRLLATINVDPKFASVRNKERMVLDAEDLVEMSLIEKQAESKDLITKNSQFLRKVIKKILAFEFKSEEKTPNPYEYLDHLTMKIVTEKASLEGKKTYKDLSEKEQETVVKSNLEKVEYFKALQDQASSFSNRDSLKEFENILYEMFNSGLLNLSVILKKGLLDRQQSLSEKSDSVTEFLEDKIKTPIYLKKNLNMKDIQWSDEIKKLKHGRISFKTFKDVLSTAVSVNLVHLGEVDKFLDLNEPLTKRARTLADLLNNRLELQKKSEKLGLEEIEIKSKSAQEDEGQV